MFKQLLKLRFLTIIIVLFTAINAIAFIAMGVYMSIEGILGVARGEIHTDAHPGLKILESLDVFLVALVFLIFALGLAKLFVIDESDSAQSKVPAWLNIKSFTALKLLLWEAVLTTLVVYFISDVVKKDGHYSWELLILPASILLLSLSIMILRKHSDH